MLTWASPFNICCFLDNHSYASASPVFECLLAAGAVDSFTARAGTAFSGLQEWAAGRQDWLFGHFAYDLVAETEGVANVGGGGYRSAARDGGSADATDEVGFPDLFFFIPDILIQLQADHIRIGCFHGDPGKIWEQISQTLPAETTGAVSPAPLSFCPRFTRDEYLSTIQALRGHILRGDVYELNFCQEFFARGANPDLLATWWALSKASPNPFAAFYRLGERYLLCASPERFLKKTGRMLFAQPIKGTAARQKQDPEADRRQGEALYNSAKDRAENVMVVDLVRNDLARVCIPGSVRVTELFGVYPFPQVYQMISSITGEMRPGVDWTEAIRANFPMGSMTGAPKNRVVQLIGRYERSRRGLFSGAVGYVTPDGDFDFNVVIRSLLYNRESQYLSYQVGSGITFYSDAEAEYEECLVKAEGIRLAVGSQ